MIKKILVLIKTLFVLFILFSNSAIANHKGKVSKTVSENMDLTQKEVKIKYCAKSAKKVTENLEKDGSLTEKAEELATVKTKWKITNFHDPNGEPVSKIVLKGKKPPYKISDETKLKDVLDMLCVHRADEEITLKSDIDLYKKIAEANNILDKKTDKPSYKAPIGSKVYNNGIKIPEEVGIVIIHTPDYLIEKTKAEILKIEKAKKDKAVRKKERKFLEENRPKILEKAEDKKAESDELIGKTKKKLIKTQSELKGLDDLYNDVQNAVQKLFDLGIQNKSDKEISSLLEDLYDKKDEYFSDKNKIEKFNDETNKIKNNFNKLKQTSDYKNIVNIINGIVNANSKKRLTNYEKQIKSVNIVNTDPVNKSLDKITKEIEKYKQEIIEVDELRAKIKELDETIGTGINFLTLGLYLLGFLIVAGIGAYIYFQNKKISSLSSATKSAGKKFSELEGQLKSTSDQIRSVASRKHESSGTSGRTQPVSEKPKTQEEIIANKFDDLVSDYREALENFSKVASFKQKWSGLALNRKERQDGSKTILINSSRAFEKAEIWCVGFDGKYFGFPGSSVKTNMATYMNLDFEKAQRDFKGVFLVASGSSYSTEPCVLRRGGAGFVVERVGKLTFPQ